MAETKNPQNFGQAIYNQVREINEEKLDAILSEVSRYIKNVDKTSKDKNNKDTKTYSIFDCINSNTKNTNLILTRNAETQNAHAKAQLDLFKEQNEVSKKYNEENINVQKRIAQFSEQNLRETSNQARLQERLSRLTERRERTQDRIQRDAFKLEQRNSIQNNIMRRFEEQHFELQSDYYNYMREKMGIVARGWDDFRNNTRGFLLDKLGLVLGKVFDKSIETVIHTLKAIADGIVTGLKDAYDSFFDAIENSKRTAEDIAKETAQSFEVSQNTVDMGQQLIFSLTRGNEKDQKAAQYAYDNQKEIFSFLQKNLGANWTDTSVYSADTQKQMIKALGVAIENGVNINEIAKYNSTPEEMLEVLKYESDLRRALKTLPEKMSSTVEAGLIDINDRNLRISKEQAMDMNKSFALFNASMAENNKDYNERQAEAIKSMTVGIMEMTDISSRLSDNQVKALQGYGYDLKTIQRTMQTGTNEQRAEMIRILGEAASREDLAPIFEELGLLHGGQAAVLKGMEYKESEKAKEEFGKDAVDEAAGYKSKTGIMDIERNTFFEALKSARSKGVNENNELLFAGLKSIMDDTQRLVTKNLSYENFDKVLDAVNSGIVDGLSEEEQNLYKILTEKKEGEDISFLQKAQNNLKDLSVVAEQATRMNNLGLDKALASGGINGVLGKVFELSVSSAFSPEQRKELSDFIGNLGTTLKPVFNVLKDVIISPVIDSIQDTIGRLLGEILVFMKEKWPLGSYSEEEKQADKIKFLKKNDVYNDMQDMEGENTGVYSSAYRELLNNKEKLNSMNIKDIDNLSGISEQERLGLKNFILNNSKALNTSGKFLGKTEVTDLDLSNESTRNQANNWMQGFKVSLKKTANGNYESDKAPESFYDFITFINESDDVNKTLEFLSADKEIDKSELDNVYKKLTEMSYASWFGVQDTEYVQHLYNLFGIKKSVIANQNDLYAFLAYELLKSKSDLMVNTRGRNSFMLFPHDDKYKNHIGEQGWGEEEYTPLATGGVVEKKEGGTKALLGEAGYDEIVIPMDPTKEAHAQRLLRLAKEKYNVYLKDPENVSDILQKWIKALLFETKLLMLQVDPIRDAVANATTQQVFNYMKMIGMSEMRKKMSGTEQQVLEEITGGGMPTVGAPIENAPNIDSIRKAIIDKAISKTGTPYKEAPNGLVCNELVNFAYASVLGAKNYEELLHNAGYNHDRMHTISGFIDEVGKNGFKGMLRSSVEYSALNGVAKPADLVFSANTGKLKSSFNPDNHGHVNLYIDADNKIDASSMKRAGKDGVGIHKPLKGPHMLINILDLMPESWYMEKGLLKYDGDGSDLMSKEELNYTPNLSYTPALQSVPDASDVQNSVSRYNSAEAKKEKTRSENQENKAVAIVKKAIENLANVININKKEKEAIMSIDSCSQSRAFCTNYTPKNPVGWGQSRY